MRLMRAAGTLTAIATLFAVTCGGDGEGRRIQIIQNDDACTPTSIEVTHGEKITFELVNRGSKDKEFEGIEGTRFEEVKVPSGKTRTSNWTAPGSPGTASFQCYLPGGATTIVTAEIR